MMKNPEAMRKAREEVDEVLGDQQIQIGDLSKLKYINGQYVDVQRRARHLYLNSDHA